MTHKKFASQPLNSQCCAAASYDTGTVQIERDRSRAARRRLGRTARGDPFCEDLRIRHAQVSNANLDSLYPGSFSIWSRPVFT